MNAALHQRPVRLFAPLFVLALAVGPDFRCDPSLACSASTVPPVPVDASAREPWCTRAPCGAVAVAAGAQHTCALVGTLETDGPLATNEARAVCWGRNDEGQVDPARPGEAVTEPTVVPVRSLGPADASQHDRVAAGTLQSCASVNDPSTTAVVVCWGSNGRGLLGGSDPDARIASSQLGASVGGGGLVSVSAAATHTCGAREREGACAGDDQRGAITGQLAPPSYCVGPLGCSTGGLVGLAAGGTVTCGLLPEGGREVERHVIRCRGAPTFQGLEGWSGTLSSRLAVGASFACGLGLTLEGNALETTQVGCWSEDSVARIVELPGPVASVEVGGSLEVEVASPTELQVTGPIGNGHACALLTSGAIYCWGDNGRGQLGDGTQDDRTAPVRVEGLPPAVALSLGGEHTCAVTREGEVYCWGDNRAGQLGRAPNDGSAAPLRVMFDPRD